MSSSVRELCAEWAPPGSVKIEGNVIPGVKVLGFESPSHKRRYSVGMMRTEAPKYENARVNIDHPAGLYDTTQRNMPRSAMTAFGRIRNPRVDESRGLIGDLHFNPGHPMAAAVKWAAENDPTQFALSHLADLVGEQKDGWFNTHKIDKLHSVDVVSNGGTTSGLFESAATEGESHMEPVNLTSMTREAIQTARQDLKVLTAAEALANENELEKLKAKLTAAEAENVSLKSKVEGFEAIKAKDTRDETRKTKIAEAKLPEHLATTTFTALCLAAETSDERFTALLSERKELAEKTTSRLPTKPKSESKGAAEAGGHPAAKTSTSKDFAAALKTGAF